MTKHIEEEWKLLEEDLLEMTDVDEDTLLLFRHTYYLGALATLSRVEDSARTKDEEMYKNLRDEVMEYATEHFDDEDENGHQLH